MTMPKGRRGNSLSITVPEVITETLFKCYLMWSATLTAFVVLVNKFL